MRGLKKEEKDYEKESRINAYISSSVIILIGIVCVVFAVSGGAYDSTTAVVGGIMGAFFIAVGLFMLARKRVEQKEDRMVKSAGGLTVTDNEDMPAASRAALRKSREKCAAAAHSHKGLEEEFRLKPIYISAAVFAVLTIINIIVYFVGYIYYMLVILDVIALIVFIYCVSGSGYKKALAAYAAPEGGFEGIGKDEAEKEYAQGAVYREGETICVGERFVFGSTTAACYALDIRHIVWVFPRVEIQYNYYNGVYTGKTEIYRMMFCMDNGMVYQFKCPIGACSLIIDDIIARRQGVITGWSSELGDVYENVGGMDFMAVAPKLVKLPDPYNLQK